MKTKNFPSAKRGLLGLVVLLALSCTTKPKTEITESQQQPSVKGDDIKVGRLEIALCTDDSCGEKEVSAFFQNEKAFVSSDLGEEKVLAVPVDYTFYSLIWSRVEKLHFEVLPVGARSTASIVEPEGVPGCKASFHVRIQMPKQIWYTNVCRNREDAATALSFAVRDVDFMVLKNKSRGVEIK